MYHVRDLFKEAEVEIPDAVLDRVHRISKENIDVIVRYYYFLTSNVILS